MVCSVNKEETVEKIINICIKYIILILNINSGKSYLLAFAFSPALSTLKGKKK